jgi:Ca2+-binding RTX toxin-like protein
VRWLLIPVILATVVSVALIARGDPPRAPAACTWTGTAERDVKTGTADHNELCSKAGNDFIHGQGGNDVLRAGEGRDVAVGGGGRDVVRGGAGPDRLFAVDDHGGDWVYGGPGVDQCFVDPGDQLYGCDRAFRSNEPEMATALAQSLGSVMEIIEAVTPSLTIPPPVVTITSTIVLPPCNNGPPDPPPFCEGG